MMRWIGSVVLLGMLLAGCVDESEGDPDAVVVAEGRATGAGTETDTASCPAGTARLAGMAVVDEGTMDVVVRDADGNEVLRRSFDGRTDVDEERVDGGEGDWTILVERSEGFDGGYSFMLMCRGA